MSLIACKECQHQIARNATTCPSCGSTAPHGLRGRRIGGLIYLALIAAAFMGLWRMITPSEATGVTITQAEYGEKWPFTVESVELKCEGSPPAALVKAPDGKLYALNGSARTSAAANGWEDGRTITKPSVELPQVPMSISDITGRALKLCSSYAG